MQISGQDRLYSVQRVYSGRIGPTPDGKVEVSFDLTIAAGLYEQVGIQATIADRGDEGTQRERDLEGETTTHPAGASVTSELCSSLSEFVSCTTALLADAPDEPQ